MKFGPEPTADCTGAVLAHGHRLPDGGSVKKGRILDAADIAALVGAGIDEITVARLEAGEIGENEGARIVAEAAAGTALRTGIAATGRVNLYAERAGLVIYDPTRLNEVNRVSESVTVAAARPFAPLAEGRLAATVKIIPLGLDAKTATTCATQASAAEPLFAVAPFKPMRIGLLQSQLAFARGKLLDKTREVLANERASSARDVDMIKPQPNTRNGRISIT